MHLHRL